MPVVRPRGLAFVWFASMIAACKSSSPSCPEATLLIEVPDIPAGQSQTVVALEIDNPLPDNGLQVITELSAESGAFDDRFARETTYTCAHDVSGPVEICVRTTFGNDEARSGTDEESLAENADSTIGAAEDYLRGPHVTVLDPLACSEVECTTITCPEGKPENSCPIIEALRADDTSIPLGETTTTVRVDAMDLDGSPEPLRTELRSETGVFEDRFAQETAFTCGEPGPVEICVDASDGDPACDQTRCRTLQCPSNIPINFCPSLFVINAIPSKVPRGETTTLVQTRAQDIDRFPLPLTLTLRALSGRFQNSENMTGQSDVVFQDATYICERPGDVEICVDATDGACLKTRCAVVECPADLTTPL